MCIRDRCNAGAIASSVAARFCSFSFFLVTTGAHPGDPGGLGAALLAPWQCPVVTAARAPLAPSLAPSLALASAHPPAG
eukprot:72040-Prorocentrum_minimum.AAC.1